MTLRQSAMPEFPGDLKALVGHEKKHKKNSGGAMAEAIFEVFRGDRQGGQPATYRVPIAPGMVVLDALHHIQAHQPDLAVR
jgi:hypothetical protein